MGVNGGSGGDPDELKVYDKKMLPEADYSGFSDILQMGYKKEPTYQKKNGPVVGSDKSNHGQVISPFNKDNAKQRA